uniref:Uncharacterized protein n=1 Tax=Anguilla anguilla TaxID=7936 RepID=A0A0E9R8E6_ANGAN
MVFGRVMFFFFYVLVLVRFMVRVGNLRKTHHFLFSSGER